VTVGLFNYDVTEILSGLAEGETVVVPDDTVELQEGLKVRRAG
jgi:hypothetical protein